MGSTIGQEEGVQSLMSIELNSGGHLDATLVEAEGAVGAALLVHGITVDKDEGGMYERLANNLAEIGCSSFRFSFLGHGKSSGSDTEVNVRSQIEEFLQAFSTFKTVCRATPRFVVASSFGAVSTLCALKEISLDLDGLILWNPVLSLRHTFVEPELPWGLENFGIKRISSLKQDEFISVDGFKFSKKFFSSMDDVQSVEKQLIDQLPTLIIHGTRDSYVSYEVAMAACDQCKSCTFVPVKDSDHGFDGLENEEMARTATVDWIKNLCPKL